MVIVSNPNRSAILQQIPIELKNGRYTNRVRPFSPEKRVDVMTWMEKPGRHVTVSNAPCRAFRSVKYEPDFSTTTWRRAPHLTTR